GRSTVGDARLPSTRPAVAQAPTVTGGSAGIGGTAIAPTAPAVGAPAGGVAIRPAKAADTVPTAPGAIEANPAAARQDTSASAIPGSPTNRSADAIAQLGSERVEPTHAASGGALASASAGPHPLVPSGANSAMPVAVGGAGAA